MLVAVTYRAKKGRERELERLLDDPETGRRVAQALGASRNVLFLGHGTMVRVLEFPEGVAAGSMSELAGRNPAMKEFLHRLAPLIEDGFDPDDPRSFEAFDRRITVPLAYDVQVDQTQAPRAPV